MALENKLNITDSTELARMEEKISKKKAVELFENGYLDAYEAGSFQMLAAIHRYLFDEICIDVDENDCITSIYSRFDEGKTEITVNDISNIKTIDEVEEILGEDYYDGIFDWEQFLNSYVYYDRENNMVAEFVYFNFDEQSENNRLVTWINIYSK